MDQCVKEDIQGDTFKNCKIAFYNQNHCSICRDNYYLYQPDNLCYKQTDEFNKCSNVAKNSENKNVCTSCEDLYYLGEDGICSPIAGCAKSQDGKCLECYSGLCRNKQKGTCDQNSYIDEDDKEEPNNGVCFRCKETNDAGTQCTQCEDGYVLSNGFCTDKVHCVEESSDGKCTKCIRNEFKDGFLKSYCVNNKYGCVETVDGCLTCDDMYHFNYCTTCHYGFYFDDYYEFFKKVSKSKYVYARRMGYVLGLKFVRDKNILKTFTSIKDNEDYMVMMGEAWLIATVAIYYPDECYEYLLSLNDMTLKRKVISKMVDSYRISSEIKEKFKLLRE
jgi:hypothetical protein